MKGLGVWGLRLRVWRVLGFIGLRVEGLGYSV